MQYVRQVWLQQDRYILRPSTMLSLSNTTHHFCITGVKRDYSHIIQCLWPKTTYSAGCGHPLGGATASVGRRRRPSVYIVRLFVPCLCHNNGHTAIHGVQIATISFRCQSAVLLQRMAADRENFCTAPINAPVNWQVNAPVTICYDTTEEFNVDWKPDCGQLI